MKKKYIGLLILSLTVSATAIYSVIKSSRDKEGISFDNSKPGLWKVISHTTFPSDSRLNKTDNFEICLTKEKINETKIKPIEDKLDLKDLKCERNIKRINGNEGEFSLVCSKPNTLDIKDENSQTKVSKNVASVKVNGKVISKENSGGLEINYEINDGGKQTFKFQLKTQSQRVGECK